MFPSKTAILSGGASTGFENTYSLEFDGTNDYVDVGTADVGGTTGSISFWAKRNDTSRSWDSVIYGTGDNYLINFYGATTILIRAGGAYAQLSSMNVDDTNWHHWVYVRVGTTITVYRDGGNSQSGSSGDWTENVILKQISASGAPFKGHMDEVAIWDAALDADAVAAIYNSGTPIALDADDGNYDNSGDLQGWWRFEEGSGTSAADSSTNSNAGTLTNGVAYSADVPS